MTNVFAELSVSLDGFVAGPNPSHQDPLGIGGMQLHEWAFASLAWRESHGRGGGETNADSDLIAENIQRSGADIMGRRMFSGGAGPWEDDGMADGWWGDDPPFHQPVFVLTHHEREPLALSDTTFTFVTDGIESTLEQARAAAGDKDVHVAGGATPVQQYLRAGLLDELQVHLVPVLLGSGTRLLDGLDPGRLERTRVIDSPTVMHLTYRVLH